MTEPATTRAATRPATDRTYPAAVLFDMDGTLLDSEPLWERALTDLADRHGGILSAAARTAIVGTDTAETMRLFYADLGLSGDTVAGDLSYLAARATELFAVGLEWRPGAAELLAAVRAAGLPTALVTSTVRPMTELALDTLGRDSFDAVVCGDEVAQPKPHPEPYRTAADLLGVPIGHCVAIEDSVIGATSAHTAGASVLVVGSTADLPDAVHRAVSLAEVDLDQLTRLVAR